MSSAVKSNGSPNGASTTSIVKSIRRERRLWEENLLLQQVLRQAQRVSSSGPAARRRLMEVQDQWDYLNDYSDLLDRLRQPDSALLSPISTANDRRYGANWPFWRTWTDHAKLRGLSRLIVGISEVAEGALDGLSSYVVGEGSTYHAVPKAGKEDVVPDALLKVVNRWLEEFQELNNYSNLEDEYFQRTRRDGETFLRYFALDEGETECRFIEPEYVQESPVMDGGGPYGLEEYSFGVHTAPGDIARPLGYWVSYIGSPATGEYVLASQMQHFKLSDRNIKRGKPDFVFDQYDHLKACVRSFGSMAEAVGIQASIAMIRQHQKAVPNEVTSFQAALADYTRPDPFTGNTVNVKRIKPGTVIDIGKEFEYVMPAWAQNFQYWGDIVQKVLQVVGVKWQAPAWLMTGDASNTNFASSLTAESPFVRANKKKQKSYTTAHVASMWIAVRHYCEARQGVRIRGTAEDGREFVRRYNFEDIRRLVEIQAEPQSLVVRSELEEAQKNQIYAGMGVKSIQTVAAELGLDYERETLNNEEHAERVPQASSLPAATLLGIPGQADRGGKPFPQGSGEPGLAGSPGGAGYRRSLDRRLANGGVNEGRDTDTTGPIILDVPVRRQDNSWNCGPAAVQSILAYWEMENQVNEQGLAALLGTIREAGTDPDRVASCMDTWGFWVAGGQHCTLGTLEGWIGEGEPVLCSVQMYGGGHYLVVVGLDDQKVYTVDPAAGKTWIGRADFEKRWHDEAGSVRYENFALAFRPKVQRRQNV